MAGRKMKKRLTQKVTGVTESIASTKYPRHAIDKSLRIPRALLDQNAGRECSERDAARFVGVGFSGEFQLEISSAIKYGFLQRPSSGQVTITDLAKKIIRPQNPEDEINGLREAVFNAPGIFDVYSHYRGENLPDEKFFDNTLVENFKIPREKLAEFKQIFQETLKFSKLLEEHNGKWRVVDVSNTASHKGESTETLKRLEKTVVVSAGDTCFVMMPFAPPLGDYYKKIYEPAIKKAGLVPIRADADIFGTGKIMDQVRRGIATAKVLLAELTSRNPNVFYELGLAHALKKPVVLVSSNEKDVPFDLQHIRVIYYDVNDPFWGEKLIAKVAENILSAIKNPAEAIFAETD